MTRTQALPLHFPQNQRHCERSEAIRKDSLAIMVIMEIIHLLLLLFKCRVGFSPPSQRHRLLSANICGSALKHEGREKSEKHENNSG